MLFDVLRSGETASTFSGKPNAFFDTFWDNFAKMVPKVSRNDRYHKVFPWTFPEASKRCVTNAFLMFCEVVKRLQLLVKNLMLFDTFEGLFPKRASKWSINDRFYKVFWTTFLQAPKRCFTKGFLMFCEVVKRHQLLVKNVMVLMLLRAFCPKVSQKYQ